MRTIIKSAAVVGLTSILTLLPVASTYALTQTAQERIATRRCTVAETRIAATLARMKTVGERRTVIYQNTKDRVTAHVIKLQQAGYDTSKLSADLKTFDADLLAYRAQTKTLYDNLQSTQDYACGQSEGQFVAALGSARTQLANVRTAADKIETDYRTLIKPDVTAAIQWLKDHKNNATTDLQ